MTDEGSQLSLLSEVGGPEPHARFGDPASSELTVKSLGRDSGYNWRIFACIVRLSARDEWRTDWRGESAIAVMHDRPVTDDMILELMERDAGRRYQRNVVARQRGIIREAGWIKPVDAQFRGSGKGPCFVIAHIPTWRGIDAWHRHLNERTDI